MSQAAKHEGLVDAPVPDVWELLEDPARFPEWSAETLAVTGLPTEIERGSTFRLTGRGPWGMKATTTYEVTELEDLHEIKLRCQKSGYYSHWRLTEARGDTFIEVEFGIEPKGLQAQAIALVHTRGYLRRAAQEALDGIRDTLRRR